MLLRRSYQVKAVDRFLSLLKLLPLDDVLHGHGRFLVTGQPPADLGELQEAAALGVEGGGMVGG